jgi:chromate transporter
MSDPVPSSTQLHPTRREAFRFWLKLGFISFGGPMGQIAIMHTELVEKRRWISEARFLHALNYCMLLPGPEAQQLATYIGWLLHRTWGGVIAGTLFVLPSAVMLWGLSLVYVRWGQLPWLAAVFAALKPAVLAIVVVALVRLGRRALRNGFMGGLAVLAFVAIFSAGVPFPLIIALAALAGLTAERVWPGKFQMVADPGRDGTGRDVTGTGTGGHPAPARTLRVAVVCVALWWIPIVLTGAWLGWDHVLFRQGVFFSQAAMVTFGGAYSVLPYVSQQAVEQYQWLSAGQMLDGLALAETTPGPLIIVLQFVAFVGAWNLSAPFSPLVAATLGAALTTWATFLPCFLWIFLGAPYIERLREHAALTAALSAITAAVVGVVLNLAVWFGWHVLWPRDAVVDWGAWGIALVALVALQRWKWDIMLVVAGAAAVGLLRWAFMG